MRIVYLHQHFRTPSENGGVRSWHFARALVKRGHDVHMITARGARDHSGVVSEAGFTVHYLDVAYDQSMGTMSRILSFARFAQKASWLARRLRPDAVVASSTPLTIAIPGLVATAGRPSPLVFEARDVWPAVPIAMGVLRNPLVKRAAGIFERMVYRTASTVITLSDDMADAIAKTGVARDRIEVVTNISDIEAFDPLSSDSGDWRRAHPEFEGRRLAVYCGTFGRVNGLSYLVDLAVASRDIGSTLAFVAIGEGSEKSEVRRRAAAAGVLDDNLFLLEAVPKRRLPDVLGAATVGFSFVIDVPELEANSANKFFDTLAAETPMVINHGGWQAEVLESSRAGVRLSRDAQVAARQLNRFVDDPAALDIARRSARALARGRYSLASLAATFCGVVERDTRLAARS